jgi:hypothetical protein
MATKETLKLAARVRYCFCPCDERGKMLTRKSTWRLCGLAAAGAAIAALAAPTSAAAQPNGLFSDCPVSKTKSSFTMRCVMKSPAPFNITGTALAGYRLTLSVRCDGGQTYTDTVVTGRLVHVSLDQGSAPYDAVNAANRCTLTLSGKLLQKQKRFKELSLLVTWNFLPHGVVALSPSLTAAG